MLAAYFGLEAKCWFDAGYDAVDKYQQVMSDMQSIVQDGARVCMCVDAYGCRACMC
jgi:hypothetical protein